MCVRQNRDTALIMAIKWSRMELAELLLNAGADINIPNEVYKYRVVMFQFLTTELAHLTRCGV